MPANSNAQVELVEALGGFFSWGSSAPGFSPHVRSGSNDEPVEGSEDSYDHPVLASYNLWCTDGVKVDGCRRVKGDGQPM